MDEFNLVNSIDEIYSKPIIEKADSYVCPVCNLSRKKKRTIESHMEKRECYDIGSLLKGSEYEKTGLSVFREIVESDRMSMMMFRRNPMYKTILKFVVHCYRWEIHDAGLYYEVVSLLCKKDATPSYIFKASLDDKFVKEYREVLHRFPDLVDDKFYETHKERLSEDQLFLVRSLEKGHVSVTKAIDELYEVIEELPYEYFERVSNVFEKAKH